MSIEGKGYFDADEELYPPVASPRQAPKETPRAKRPDGPLTKVVYFVVGVVAIGVVWAGFALASGGSHPAPVQAKTHRSLPDAATRTISRAQFGAAWPFTVPRGTLVCAGPGPALTFRTDDGRAFAVNGISPASDIAPIWRKQVPKYGVTNRVPLDPINMLGHRMCR